MSLTSLMENLYPGHACAPNENDMTFARPGKDGAFAAAGREAQRSGLEMDVSTSAPRRVRNDLLELSCVAPPDVFREIDAF